MRTKRHSTREISLSLCVILGSAVAMAGCGRVIAFEGATPINIAGDPPPLPPPPPEPEPEPEPPKPPPRVEVRDNKIEIREKIQFEYNKAEIKEVSFDLLDEIAKVIKENPQIKKIQIEGHASSDGNDAYNLALSDRRAKAVRQHLIEKGGIPAETLVAKGFGETKPIADNETEEGREKNRRVEFNIIEQDVTKKKVEIDETTGKEKVVEETKEAVKKATAPATDDKAK
jgi:outer membrane protein OmpA-like peptidoglycan-associated protein